MTKLIELPPDTWNEVSYWTIKPKPSAELDRNYMTFNHDDMNGYLLFSENLLNTKGLTCLEFHIFMNLHRDESDLEQVLMLSVPFLICGPGGPTQEQLDADIPDTELSESAPIEYLDQPKVLEAILSLEKKGLITITRNKE